MKKVVLNVESDKYNFFIELMQSLDFVQIQDNIEGSMEEEDVLNITQVFSSTKESTKATLTPSSSPQFLNEI